MRKFCEIVRFEVADRLRRWSTLGYVVVTALIAFSAIEDIMLQEARGAGNIHANAPFLVAGAMMFLNVMTVVITAALFGDAAARDAQTGMDALFFTTPIRRREYLGGRFVGALIVNAILLAVVPLVLALASLTHGDTGLFGTFRLLTYLQPFALMTIPSLLAMGAITFVPAALTRRTVAAFGGGLLLFMGTFVSLELLSQRESDRKIGALIDPVAYSAMRVATAYWTAAERDVQQIALDGFLLWNRVAWLGAGAAMLALLAWRFRFAHEGDRRRRRKQQMVEAVDAAEERYERGLPLIVPRANPDFGFVARARQTLAIAQRSFSDVVLSRYSLISAAVLPLFVFVDGADGGYVLDTPTLPTTYFLAHEIIGELGPLMYLLIALYAGEIVWRERDARVSDIADAAPLPNGAMLLGKFAALTGGIVVMQALLMIAAVAVQGFDRFDLPLYVQTLFGMQLVDYVLWAALAMLLHVLSPNKYAGHLLFVVYLFFFALAPRTLGLEHPLLRYPAAPRWDHSALSGFEPFLGPHLWFKAYWAAWALLFAVIANLFWMRGRDRRLRRMSRPMTITATIAVLLIAGIGGFIFYNTNVVNTYRSSDERNRELAEFERRYKRYERLPQPRVAGVKLHVELYPERRAADVRGTFTLANRSKRPVDAVHVVSRVQDVALRSVTFDRPSRPTVTDDEHGYRIYALDRAIASGESVQMQFDLTMQPRGFRTNGIRPDIVRNGSYFDHALLPVVGYHAEFELTNGEARRELGLPERKPASARDAAARLLPPRNTEWFDSEVILGTSGDQIALAPGALHKTWMANGRRYFHYRSDAPIKNVYAFMSAAYAVREDRWKHVKIEVLHDPEHAFNIDRVVGGAKAALDYCSANFGPYLYSQIRIAEIPRHAGNFARAFPNLVGFSEGFGFTARVDDGIDYPFAVAAHEVAHQWWGGIFAPAEVEGRRMLFETMAHYSALMTMEQVHGREEVQRLLELMRHRYLIGRQNRRGKEMPLLFSRDDQRFIHYDKGAVVMYTLREYIGEERVNLALRRFLEKHRFAGPPYPTTLDLYAELQAVTPDAHRELLKDLFEEITVWELRTTAVEVSPTPDGAQRVTITIDAQKLKADGDGRDRRVPMHDLVDVAVFAAVDAAAEERSKPLYLAKHRIRSGEQTISVTVRGKPARAGVDPFFRLIDRQKENNVMAVAK